ncbi:hypothetical protein Droror1_Dr00009572 [Drosera rotundifolia]
MFEQLTRSTFGLSSIKTLELTKNTVHITQLHRRLADNADMVAASPPSPLLVATALDGIRDSLLRTRRSQSPPTTAATATFTLHHSSSPLPPSNLGETMPDDEEQHRGFRGVNRR